MIPREEIPIVVALHDAFGLTAREARGVALLARGGVVPFELIRDVYCERADAHPYEVRHFKKRVQKKAPALRIQNIYGTGYELDPNSLKAVRAVIQRARA